MAITIATPPLLMVSWSCTRCGHTGGVAKTTIPVEPTFQTAMGQTLLHTLRQKLVRLHQARQGCVALPEDFKISRYVP